MHLPRSRLWVVMALLVAMFVITLMPARAAGPPNQAEPEVPVTSVTFGEGSNIQANHFEYYVVAFSTNTGDGEGNSIVLSLSKYDADNADGAYSLSTSNVGSWVILSADLADRPVSFDLSQNGMVDVDHNGGSSGANALALTGGAQPSFGLIFEPSTNFEVADLGSGQTISAFIFADSNTLASLATAQRFELTGDFRGADFTNAGLELHSFTLAVIPDG